MTDISVIAAVASTVSAAGVVFTIVSKRRSRAREELHESMTLWVRNSGGSHIKDIVAGETRAIIRRIDEHELTEPERWREAYRKMRADENG